MQSVTADFLLFSYLIFLRLVIPNNARVSHLYSIQDVLESRVRSPVVPRFFIEHGGSMIYIVILPPPPFLTLSELDFIVLFYVLPIYILCM